MNGREAFVGFVLLAFAFVLGVYPDIMLGLMHESVNHLVVTLDKGYQNSTRRSCRGRDGDEILRLAIRLFAMECFVVPLLELEIAFGRVMRNMVRAALLQQSDLLGN